MVLMTYPPVKRLASSHRHSGSLKTQALLRIILIADWVYKYGNHLTPGLTEVRVYAAGLTSFLAGFFRAGDLAGIPALKTW